MGTAAGVLGAQTVVAQAKTDYHSSLYDYQNATARLRNALGEL